MNSEIELERLQATFTGRQPDSGWGYVLLGIVVSLAGILLSAVEPAIGILAFALGGVLGSIGIIAVGITVGVRRADYRRDQQLLAQLRRSEGL